MISESTLFSYVRFVVVMLQCFSFAIINTPRVASSIGPQMYDASIVMLVLHISVAVLLEINAHKEESAKKELTRRGFCEQQHFAEWREETKKAQDVPVAGGDVHLYADWDSVFDCNDDVS